MQLPFFSGIRVLKDASWPANEIMEILYYMNDVKGEKKFLDKQIIYLHGCLSSRLTASLNSCCKSSEQSSQVQFCDWLWSSYFPNVVHRSTCRLGDFLCQNNNFSVTGRVILPRIRMKKLRIMMSKFQSMMNGVNGQKKMNRFAVNYSLFAALVCMQMNYD